MKRSIAGVAITLVAAGLAGGCGANDDGDSDAGPNHGATHPANAPLAKAEYIKRADVICETAVERIQVAGVKIREQSAKSGRRPPDAQVATFIAQTSLPIYDDMLDELRVLPPPTRDATTIDGFITSLERAIDTVEAAPEKYTGGGASDPFDDPTARAKAYGMKVCGS